MRQVSGCDFCGETASGTFDVLPPEYDPAGKGKRMVLCDHCRDALASILDPLLDSKSADTGGDVEPKVNAVASTGEPSELSTAASPPGDESEAAPEETATDDEGESDGPPEERSAESRMAKTGAGTSSRVPKGYRKTLRFLENREMPIDREEAVEMVTDVYGLEAEAVEAALEHAANHGRLKVSQGQIKRP